MLAHHNLNADGYIHAASKENAIRNIMPSSRPSTSAYSGFNSSDSPYIEHTRRDSRGVLVTKRYLKGPLLGKGGFAKCFRLTDADTNEEWACKVVQKASLTKQRHKAKVRLCFLVCRKQRL